MNRTQRKRIEKDLGIKKHRKSLSRQQKFELLRQNVQEGKQRHRENTEARERQESEADGQLQSNEVAKLALRIAKAEGMPYIDALNEANKRLNGGN